MKRSPKKLQKIIHQLTTPAETWGGRRGRKHQLRRGLRQPHHRHPPSRRAGGIFEQRHLALAAQAWHQAVSAGSLLEGEHPRSPRTGVRAFADPPGAGGSGKSAHPRDDRGHPHPRLRHRRASHNRPTFKDSPPQLRDADL